jgi:hypothetical protein
LELEPDKLGSLPEWKALFLQQVGRQELDGSLTVLLVSC